MYQSSLDNLEQLGIKINNEFLFSCECDTPLYRGVKELLNSIGKKGLKLTPNGFLPTKLVKQIVELASTEADERFLKLQTRFYEEENVSANMARVVAKELKLTRVQTGKLFLTKKGTLYLSLNAHEQYVILFNMMLSINIGYFDGYQKALCVHNSSIVMLQLLRNIERRFRTSEVYAAILLESYPILYDEIDELEVSNFEDDKASVYAKIAQTRLFERFFLPLGLIKMNTQKYPLKSTYAKSNLLERLLEAKNAINKDLVISKKLMQTFLDDMKKSNLEINLLEIIMFLFAQFAHTPLPPKSSVVSVLMEKHLVVGTLRAEYEHFYDKLIESVITTFEEFTQLDSVGAKSENLMYEYKDMIGAIFSLASSSKPFNTIQKLYILPGFILDILQLHHNIDQFSKDFVLECIKVFDEEFAMDVSQLMLLLNELDKDAKKLTKNKPNFNQGIKELIHIFFVVIFELRTRQ